MTPAGFYSDSAERPSWAGVYEDAGLPSRRADREEPDRMAPAGSRAGCVNGKCSLFPAEEPDTTVGHGGVVPEPFPRRRPVHVLQPLLLQALILLHVPLV
jgi:hypothetical protein